MRELIDLYADWATARELPGDSGLCNYIPQAYRNELKLFVPDQLELIELSLEGISTVYWANNKPYHWYSSVLKYDLNQYRIRKAFNPFRQTIVLFICAMHNEL
jgi:hypothetical protein